MQAVMTSVAETFIIVASSATVTNSVTFRMERSCSSRWNSSFMRSATASRFSLRYFEPLLLAFFDVRRASVSFTCFETSSSLISGRTTGFGALSLSLRVFLFSPGRGWLDCGPCPRPGCAADLPLLPGLGLPAGVRVTSTFSLLRRLRLWRLHGVNPDTSIVPSTCGPVRVCTAGRKMLSLLGAASGSGLAAEAVSEAGAASVLGAAGCGAGCGFGAAASGTGSAAGLLTGFGAGLGLGERSILPRILGWGSSSLTLMTLLLIITSCSSSRVCFCASSRVIVACFWEIRSRMLSRSLPVIRLPPNSFSRTA